MLHENISKREQKSCLVCDMEGMDMGGLHANCWLDLACNATAAEICFDYNRNLARVDKVCIN